MRFSIVLSVICWMFALCPATSFAEAAELYGSIDLPADSDWVDTGVDVTANQQPYVMAFGAHQDTETTYAHGPSGMVGITSTGPFANAPENALFARVGTDTLHIGMGGKTPPMPADGRLYLRLGDGTVAGNIGTLFVLIMSNPTMTYLYDTSEEGPLGDGWISTQYVYTPGERPLVLVYGAHRDTETTVVFSPGGMPGELADGPLALPENCVLGKIGGTQAPFFLGAGGYLRDTPHQGILYLSLNDGRFDNNSGHLVVEIWDFVDDRQQPVAAELSTARILSRVNVHPGPSDGRAFVSFNLMRPASVEVAVFDVRGRKLRTLEAGPRPEGAYTVGWDGSDATGRRVASGTYFLRVDAGQEAETKPITLLR